MFDKIFGKESISEFLCVIYLEKICIVGRVTCYKQEFYWGNLVKLK
jgi:hypothetical protein